jgi:DNA-directed RNA polymerase specialized sigma24 family protein
MTASDPLRPARDEPGVLSAARAQDDASLRRALQRLVDEVLVPAAIRETGARRNQVEFLPESVVQSVIADDLARAIRECVDETHLRARLVRAIRHRVIDRTRKGGAAGAPRHWAIGPERGGQEPAAHSAERPPAMALARESALLDETAYRSLCATILQAPRDRTDRLLLEGYVLEGRRWDDVASTAGVSSAAARQRLTRLRSALLAKLCLPLRTMLDGESWAIAEALLVHRRAPADVGIALGLSSVQVERICRQRIVPTLALLHGDRGVTAILRLLGNRRLAR